MLEKCTLDHEAQMENLHNEIREKALSDAKWRQIQQEINQSVSVKCSDGCCIYLKSIGLLTINLVFVFVDDQQSDVDYSLNLGNSHLSGDPLPGDVTSEAVDALRGRYIRRLTAVLVHHVPAFWKVALAVSSGKFAKVIFFFKPI